MRFLRSVFSFVALGVVAIGMALGVSGCATFEGWIASSPTKLAIVETSVRVGTAAAVKVAVVKKPELREPLTLALAAVRAAVHDANYDPVVLRDKVQDATKHSQYSGEAVAALDLALLTYHRFFDLNVASKVDSSPALKSVMTAIMDGMDRGLAGAVCADPGGKPMKDLSDSDLRL